MTALFKHFKEILQHQFITLLRSLPPDERSRYIEAQLQKLPGQAKAQYKQAQREALAKRALENLRQVQRVEYLPESYRQYMLSQGSARNRRGGITLLGSAKLGWVLKGGLYEDVPLDPLRSTAGEAAWQTTKGQFILRLEDGLSYPQDAFVFFTDLQTRFFFFRTRNREDDPIVYAYEGGNGFYKPANSFSEFLQLCALDQAESQALWAQRRQVVYTFCREADDFQVVARMA
jgi:hypothetical protein